MKNIKKTFTPFFLVVSLMFMPCGAALAERGFTTDDATTESMIGDAVVARPLGIVSTIVGSAFFVVSLPFSALGGNTKEAAQKMVVAPAKFTFKRPLGEF